ncbi:MAG: symporter small accessory protein [Phycisphaerae bacterium]
MLGIEDNTVLAAYLLCLLSSLLCVIYGLINWNRGDDSIGEEDIRWAAEEEQIDRKL